MENPYQKLTEILLVEDNAGDGRLTQETFSPLPIYLHVVEGETSALAFLRRQGAYTQAPRPDYILLDQHRRKQSGRAVLAAIKRDSTLAFLSVIASLTSEAEWVFLRARELSANSSLIRPPHLRQILGILLKKGRQS